jgi:hypothetical protein
MTPRNDDIERLSPIRQHVQQHSSKTSSRKNILAVNENIRITHILSEQESAEKKEISIHRISDQQGNKERETA